MALLGKLVNLGGLLNGSKTLLGLVTLGYVAVGIFAPQYHELLGQLLTGIGVVLLPVGLADKVRKVSDGK